MVSGISSDVSSLQILRATQAFKKAIQASPRLSAAIEEEQSVNDSFSISSEALKANNNLNTSPIKTNNSLSGIKAENLDEIKQIANKLGNTEVSDEDIKYALRYGRSILVDRTA